MPSILLPTVEPSAVVVVTGANGFVAQHCIDQLLDQGYQVVGTVRTAAKADEVKKTHRYHPDLRLVIVADITCTEEVVAALAPHSPTAICHVATPFTPRVSDIERDLLVPAVLGSVAVLEAAAQIGNIKKVVYMSSLAAVFDPFQGARPGKTYTERDWNPQSYEDGVTAEDWLLGYLAAKACAERAVWDFMRRRRDATFDLVSLCPAMVHGPWLPGARPRSVEDINTSNAIAWSVMSLGRHSEIPPSAAPAWVDVRDVAAANLQALRVPEAAGRRFVLCAGSYSNQMIADVARDVAPNLGSIPIGEPGAWKLDEVFGVDASAAERVLGIEWRSLKESFEDMVPQLLAIPRKTATDGGRRLQPALSEDCVW